MSESLIAQPLGGVGINNQGQVPLTDESQNVVLPQVQYGQSTAEERSQPVPVEALAAETNSATGEIMERLNNQLIEFETIYAGADPGVCEPVFKHFSGVIDMVDALYEDAKRSLQKDLSDIQVDTIRSMAFSRACGARIDNFLKQLDPSLAPRVENITYALLNGKLSEEEHAELLGQIAEMPDLLALIGDYEDASRSAEKDTLRFKQLQDSILAHRNLKFWVRLRISQAYARVGYTDQALALKMDASYMGMGNPLAGRGAVGTAFVGSPDQRFMVMYEQLLAFKAKYGHCDVPRRYRENKNLAIWVANLRARRKRSLLSDQKAAMLEKIGFCWTSNRSKWQKMFSELKDFIAENGHSLVPMDYEKSPELAAWVRNLRKECRRSGVSQEKINQLRSIGFTFEVLDALWFEKLGELREFHNRFGHCRVPHRWPENPSLARWVNIQRERKRENSLPEGRSSLLDSLGFEWTPPKGRPKAG